jgi:aminopeptidase N
MTNVHRLFSFLFVLIMLVTFPASLKAAEPAAIHHELRVVLYPEERRFTAEDAVTVPEDFPREFSFFLHGGLSPSSPTPGVIVTPEKVTTGEIPIESFKVQLAPELKTFLIKYGGVIYHAVEPYGQEQARGFRMTPGIISGEGVYLSGGSLWYPNVEDGLVTFNLEVELPAGWDAVSQGERGLHDQGKDGTVVRWMSPEPQEEIYLVAAKFTEYARSAKNVLTMAFLRSPEENLADSYLDAAVQYLTMYGSLIGPYPYKKFALVENFWETGLGMPSFTLLGPRIIRFPFIINSSYPHEILHNWWGNSVYPDYSSGNWSEGLTAYLSDYLMKEQQGKGAEYRQETLQKYTDYVLTGRDFPLTEFRSRHSSPSEAVGYGKSLMFFHMLRQELGERDFIAGLRDFYREKKFHFASFKDLRESFEKVSGKDLKGYFDQWLTRPGAPELKLSDVRSNLKGDKYVVTARLEQVQKDGEYRLRIPVAVTMEGQERAYQAIVVMNSKGLRFGIYLPSQPLRIDIDPEFDIFRRLDRGEIPPALTQALGAKKMLIILPSEADGIMLKSYRELARVLGESGPDTIEVKLDKEVEKIPSDCTVTILGWENHFLKETLPTLTGYDVSIDRSDVQIGKNKIPKDNHTFVFSIWNPANKDMAILFIATNSAGALPGLGRKLPHYQKYSYLVFEGEEPANVGKGRWPVLNSPMTVFIPDADGKIQRIEMGKLSPGEPLITLPSVFSGKRMMEAITFLSSDELKGRGLGTEGLDRAAEFIARKFQEAGIKPAGDKEGSFFQMWKDPDLNIEMKNVVGVIPGGKSEMSGQSVVVGAHYDHLGMGWPEAREGNRGKIHPGADDNASGVSVLIELAEVLGGNLKPDRSVVFVAFTGEEAGRKGSKYYVANEKQYPAKRCMGMINLDTVGRLGNRKLLILGAGSAKEWMHILRGATSVTGVETETVTDSLDSSDNISFEEAGIPAVQLFSGPHLDYHRPTDTADKIDLQGLVKVASVAKGVIEYLANREEPLTFAITGEDKAESSTGKERKVSLGIIPDFAFNGKGCRLSGVLPGSPAEKSGLREGDIVIRINSRPVSNLKDLSDILKSLSPGSRISITFLREGKEMKVETEVVER